MSLLPPRPRRAHRKNLDKDHIERTVGRLFALDAPITNDRLKGDLLQIIAAHGTHRMIAAQAYQVVGYLADGLGYWDGNDNLRDAITEALDYFGDVANGDHSGGENFLPYPSGKYLRANSGVHAPGADSPQ